MIFNEIAKIRSVLIFLMRIQSVLIIAMRYRVLDFKELFQWLFS